MHRSRAFTLIELLVVIAIIAILAAILFPVFAQAKLAAKKTTDLSNLKQLSLSLNMYGTDFDDTDPITSPVLAPSFYTMPIDRTPTANPTNRSIFWANSIQPYVKSYAMYKGPQQQHDNFPFGTLPAPTTVAGGVTLNVYLNGWNATASPSPSKTVAFWNGFINEDFPGFGVETPLIYTADQGYSIQNYGSLYVFQNSGASCVASIGGFGYDPYYETTEKLTFFGNGSNLSYVDGHAKYVHFGSADYPYLVNSNGTWAAWWVDGTDSANGCNYSYTLSPKESF